MSSLEAPKYGSEELLPSQFDAVIVLGENIKRGWGPKEIRKDPFYLSSYSKANVLAATMLYLKGVTNTFIFSTGYTAGKSFLSEAEAMTNHFRKLLQPLPTASIRNPYLYNEWAKKGLQWPSVMLEENSLNTSSNAKEISKISKDNNLPNLGLLTVGFHLPRANYHFQRHGINATAIATENVLETVLPGIKDKFMNPDLVARELKRENLIMAIEKLPLGTLATGVLARVTRR